MNFKGKIIRNIVPLEEVQIGDIIDVYWYGKCKVVKKTKIKNVLNRDHIKQNIYQYRIQAEVL